MSQASQDLPDAAIGRAAPDPAPILQLGLGFWGSKTLLSAVELGVFTELADGPLGRRDAVARGWACTPRSARDFLDALVALGMLERDERRLRQHARDRPVPRPRQALVHRRHAGDGQRPAVRFWGSLTEALRTGAAAERGQDAAATSSARSTPTRQRLRQFLSAMTGLSLGAAHGDRREVPVGRATRPFVDVGSAQGRGAGAGRAGPPAPHAAAASTCRAVGPSSRSTSPRFGLADRLRFHAGRLLQRPAAARRRARHGPHPARLGPGREAALLAKAYDALPDGGALIVYEALIDDERRAERLRPADEPEHADRDARRLRLHRRRLPAAGCARPASARPASSTSSAPTRWSSASSSTIRIAARGEPPSQLRP